MRLDRNVNDDKAGKYAIIKLRTQAIPIDPELLRCADKLKEAGLIEFGNESPEKQFFVLRYRDQFTHAALHAYAQAVRDYINRKSTELAPEMLKGWEEYAKEIDIEAFNAAMCPHKLPD